MLSKLNKGTENVKTPKGPARRTLISIFITIILLIQILIYILMLILVLMGILTLLRILICIFLLNVLNMNINTNSCLEY